MLFPTTEKAHINFILLRSSCAEQIQKFNNKREKYKWCGHNLLQIFIPILIKLEFHIRSSWSSISTNAFSALVYFEFDLFSTRKHNRWAKEWFNFNFNYTVYKWVWFDSLL